MTCRRVAGLAALAVAALVGGDAGAASPAGPARAPAWRAGERLYREGRLRSGVPASAVALGDVALSGEQVSCAGCHGRSGMGSVEGARITPPVAAPYLSAPARGPRARPAYDAGTLARAIREGVDAGGNPLDPLMPRYRLGDADMSALLEYLEDLSASPSPGVSEAALHLATIITPDAPPGAREAALEVLLAYVASQNAGARIRRNEVRRLEREYAGDWVLHVWEPAGPPATWRAQLERAQAAQPVFAVVGGAGGERWDVVERFCEERGIPCLLPSVETPPLGQPSYSVYFSRGAVLEAEAVAAHLARAPGRQRVLQVFREGTGRGAAAAFVRAWRAARPGREGGDVEAMALGRRAPLSEQEVVRRARALGATVLLWWLGPEDLHQLPPIARRLGLPAYLSSTSAGGELGDTLAAEGVTGFVAHPFALPGELRQRLSPAAAWLSAHGVAPGGPRERRVQEQSLFAAQLLGHLVMHLPASFQRDHLLETMDHTTGLAALSGHYPRISFGPSQRHLSRGCWIVPLGEEGAGAEWVVP